MSTKLFSYKYIAGGIAALALTANVAGAEEVKTDSVAQTPAAETPAVAAEATAPAYDKPAMNAIDHVLQRPAPNRRFNEPDRFLNHFFMTMEAGPELLHSPNTLKGHEPVAPRAGLTAGSWFTPVHGLRLGLSAGWHNTPDSRKLAYGAFSADYMMDFSSLVSGPNPKRKFEAIGIAGVELMGQRGQGSTNFAYGGRVGLQLRYNFTPSTFIYVEPRFGLYSDGIDRHTTWQRYDWNAMVMFGFGYRIVPAWLRRAANAKFENESFTQNLFYGIGGGASGSMARNMFSDRSHYMGGAAQAFIGKMFTAASGVRVNLMAGTAGRVIKTGAQSAYAMVDVDYLLNINSAMNGYDPRRRTELNFLIGPSVVVPNHHSTHLFVGAGAGLQGVVNLTENWGLYIEPRLRLFSQNFAWNSPRRINAFGTLTFGVRYTVGSYHSPLNGQLNYNANREDWLAGKQFFMSLAGGLHSRGSRTELQKFSKAPTGEIALGRWFSPVSAWRVALNADYHHNAKRYMDITAAADYMLSLSSLSAGWNEERVLDIAALAGIDAGVGHYQGGNHFVYGVHGGIQARFNVSKSVGIFLEPQLGVKHLPKFPGRSFEPEIRLMAGVTYKLGNGNRPTPERNTDTPDYRTYVSVSGGPTLVSETFFSSPLRRVSGAVDASLGRWISNSSAFQLGVSCDMISIPRRKDANVTTIHVDYLLDLMQAMAPDPNRRFGLIGHVGAGLAFGSTASQNPGAAVQGGLRFNWRVRPDLDIFFDPTLTAWQPRVFSIGSNNHQFSGTAKALFGLALRF